MASEEYEKLVAEVRDEAFRTWDKFVHSPRNDGEPGLDRAMRGFDLVSRAVLDLIAEHAPEAIGELMHSRPSLWPPRDAPLPTRESMREK